MLAALPVAAAAPLRPLLTGGPRTARTALVGRTAAYLVVVDEPGAVLAVTRPEAVAPPCAVVLPRGTDPRDLLPVGSCAHLGGSRLTCPGVDLVVRRWWSPPALPTGVPQAAALARAESLLAAAAPTGTVPGETSSPRARALAAARPAAAALARGGADAALAHLLPVLGLGPGSTPSGDDVAAAVLLGARACGAPLPALERAAAGVRAAAPARTTPVSAGLLCEAAAGRGMRPAVELLRAVLGRGDVDAAVARLVTLGHTSGADMATGLCAAAAAALTTVASPSTVSQDAGNAVPWRRTA